MTETVPETDDLIARLRSFDYFGRSREEQDAADALCREAAAEVLRLREERDEWRSRAEFAEAQVEAVQDILPPEAGLLKKRLAEKRAALAERKEG